MSMICENGVEGVNRRGGAWTRAGLLVLATSSLTLGACRRAEDPLCNADSQKRLANAGAGSELLARLCATDGGAGAAQASSPTPTPPLANAVAQKRTEANEPWRTRPTLVRELKSDSTSFIGKPALLYVGLRPSDYFNYGYANARDSHFAFEMANVEDDQCEGSCDLGSETLTGYADKAKFRAFFDQVNADLRGRHDARRATVLVTYLPNRYEKATADHVEILAAWVGRNPAVEVTDAGTQVARAPHVPEFAASLPVAIGDDWQPAKQKLLARDPTCEVRALGAMEMVICNHLDLTVPFFKAQVFVVETRGSTTVSGVEIVGADPKADCPAFAGATREAFGSGWSFSPPDGRIFVTLTGRSEDTVVRASCSPTAVGVPRLIWTDAWTAAATGVKGMGSDLSAGELVFDRINAWATAAATLGEPATLDSEMVAALNGMISEGLSRAQSLGVLSRRSGKALERYRGVVTNEDWLRRALADARQRALKGQASPERQLSPTQAKYELKRVSTLAGLTMQEALRMMAGGQ